MGVMINMLMGNDETVAAVQASIGKKITAVTLDDNTLSIELDGSFVLKMWDNGQSCCEHRYMNSDADLASHVGETFTGAAIKNGPDVDHEYDTHEVQFLEIQTDKGSFDVVNHNEHNGYYGGFSIAATFGVKA